MVSWYCPIYCGRRRLSRNPVAFPS